jgi:hypothetical protein
MPDFILEKEVERLKRENAKLKNLLMACQSLGQFVSRLEEWDFDNDQDEEHWDSIVSQVTHAIEVNKEN